MYRYLLLSSVTVKMDYKENMENSRNEPKIESSCVVVYKDYVSKYI